MKFLRKRNVVIVIAGIVVLIALGYFRDSGSGAKFKTTEVKRGDIAATISSTGTVEPEEVIDVGAQVAGKILSFGKDKNGKTVDYGSEVEEGTKLAQIDETLYKSEVANSTAQLEESKAAVHVAEANLKQLNAKLYQAQRDWERAQKLGPSEALAQVSYDAYKSAYDTAVANVAVGQASIEQAKAAEAQAKAVLERAQQNLGYCIIVSPVKGTVIDRRVNIGQTVVSSLNAPSLFLIAKDLRRMQVWVAVGEMDIGRIHQGQKVTFTISAYPGEVFNGEVGKVRLNATMTQNVVMYTVEIITDNSNGKLLPYLTADVQFELNRVDNVLIVPKEALRWSPKAEMVAKEYREQFIKLEQQDKNPDKERKDGAGKSESSKRTKGTVWVQDGSYVKPIEVKRGMSDDKMAEIESKDIKEGMEVILGEQKPDATASDTKNPFAPQFIRGGRR